MKRLTVILAGLVISGCVPPPLTPAVASHPAVAGGRPPGTSPQAGTPPARTTGPTSTTPTNGTTPPNATGAPSTPTSSGGGGSGGTGASTGVTGQTSGSLTLSSGSQVTNTWVAGPSLQHPRAGLNVMAWGGVLLALEGDNRPSLEKLTANGQWQLDVSYDITAPPDTANLGNLLPNGSWLSALTSDATSVITAGGEEGTSSPYVLRYGASGFLSSDNNLGGAARAAAATVYNGVLYVAGGLDDTGVVQAIVQSLNLTSDAVAVPSTMPTGVAGAASVTLNGKLYIFGGYTLDSSGNPVAQSLVQVFDPATNAWRTSIDGQPGAPAALPSARHSGAAALLNGKVYLAGGMDANGTLLHDLLIYDPATNQWSSGAPMPTARALLGVGAFNGQIWAVGGFNAARTALTTVEVYQP